MRPEGGNFWQWTQKVLVIAVIADGVVSIGVIVEDAVVPHRLGFPFAVDPTGLAILNSFYAIDELLQRA